MNNLKVIEALRRDDNAEMCALVNEIYNVGIMGNYEMQAVKRNPDYPAKSYDSCWSEMGEIERTEATRKQVDHNPTVKQIASLAHDMVRLTNAIYQNSKRR